MRLLVVLCLVCMISGQALAFNTAIDVSGFNGEVTTLLTGTPFEWQHLDGKYLSYRGNAEQAATIFTELVSTSIGGQLARVTIEENLETGTLAITVAVSGTFGIQYYYYMIKKSSP